MSEQQVPTIENEEQEAQWAREQFQKANRFLAEKGIVPGQVKLSDSRFLAPALAVWKLSSEQPKGEYWVVAGEVPTDFVKASAAATARDAIRYFSLQWQIKAQQLIDTGAVKDPTQAKFAQTLVSKAEALYRLHDNNKLWTNENS
ncbi:DUF4826 family protein [Paraferrimonas haliotis]|uniref:DUF4826 domain-containing protein n=1 Tax=Paraferrimonas haliotis TaxID=2013866 RepID=A0AA37TUE4_9GAMM|nr:DUF4826 family protein [Paraferrimonas haliotis]GLS84672.1 DUF4826 domain-containing protein [Paraferrimonas haliotis]